MREQTRTALAWRSIVEDIRDLKLNLDQLQSREANRNLQDAEDTLKRMVRETYRWILSPIQEIKGGKGLSDLRWEPFQINAGVTDFGSEIERILKENELLIDQWAPVHLRTLLETWFWKDDLKEVSAKEVWRKTCEYVYLPRLRNEEAFRRTIEAGLRSREFFGIAYGKEGDTYTGFAFAGNAELILDGSLLLIEPKTATAYADALQPPAPATGDGTGGGGNDGKDPTISPIGPVAPPSKTQIKRFHGTVDLDPVKAKYQFGQVIDEVTIHLAKRADANVRITVDIDAELADGFDEDLQRIMRENCKSLHFKTADLES